jgi:hypothetical protein
MIIGIDRARFLQIDSKIFRSRTPGDPFDVPSVIVDRLPSSPKHFTMMFQRMFPPGLVLELHKTAGKVSTFPFDLTEEKFRSTQESLHPSNQARSDHRTEDTDKTDGLVGRKIRHTAANYYRHRHPPLSLPKNLRTLRVLRASSLSSSELTIAGEVASASQLSVAVGTV